MSAAQSAGAANSAGRIVVNRNVALMVAIHLLRFELRRPELFTIISGILEKYHIVDSDKEFIESLLKNSSFLYQYFLEHNVPLAEYAQVRNEVLLRSVITLEEIKAAVIMLKNVTGPLTPPGEPL
jgi:hypothetical protein